MRIRSTDSKWMWRLTIIDNDRKTLRYLITYMDLVLVGLHDCPLSDGEELVGADVRPNHHRQDGQQFLLYTTQWRKKYRNPTYKKCFGPIVEDLLKVKNSVITGLWSKDWYGREKARILIQMKINSDLDPDPHTIIMYANLKHCVDKGMVIFQGQ